MATPSHAHPDNVASSSTATKTATESAEERRPDNDIPIIRDLQPVEINSTQVNSESAALDTYFQSGFQEEDSDEDDDEPGAGGVDNDEESHIIDNAKTHDVLAWADKFIFEMQQRGGQQTENLVLVKQWKVSGNQKRNSSKSFSLYGSFSHGLLRQSTQVNYLTYGRIISQSLNINCKTNSRQKNMLRGLSKSYEL